MSGYQQASGWLVGTFPLPNHPDPPAQALAQEQLFITSEVVVAYAVGLFYYHYNLGPANQWFVRLSPKKKKKRKRGIWLTSPSMAILFLVKADPLRSRGQSEHGDGDGPTRRGRISATFGTRSKQNLLMLMLPIGQSASRPRPHTQGVSKQPTPSRCQH